MTAARYITFGLMVAAFLLGNLVLACVAIFLGIVLFMGDFDTVP